MSKPDYGQTVQVNVVPRRHSYGYNEDPPQAARSAKMSSPDFVYVNNAYVGSVDSVHSNRLYNPPTTVIREQYWACSKWSFLQRVLAISVGVLLGTVISLTIVISLKDDDKPITDIFRRDMRLCEEGYGETRPRKSLKETQPYMMF